MLLFWSNVEVVLIRSYPLRAQRSGSHSHSHHPQLAAAAALMPGMMGLAAGGGGGGKKRGGSLSLEDAERMQRTVHVRNVDMQVRRRDAHAVDATRTCR